jgi:hypothetical protein
MRRGYNCVATAPARCLHARFCQYCRRRAPRSRPSRNGDGDGDGDGAHLAGRAVPERYDLKFQPCCPWLQAGADLCSVTLLRDRFRHG